ncbi:MAG: hypothetical protein ACE149_08830 [Armatimonadota bacterium]
MNAERVLSPASVVAFIGPLGTGKTEVAINYSLALVRAGKPVQLADLDIVTPYFRVGDCSRELEQMGLRVIAARGALASFENPSLVPELAAALQEADGKVVLDVGGDPDGARLLGVYSSEIAARRHELWLVVNPYRPDSWAEPVAALCRSVEVGAGLRVTGLVANPHLGPLTSISHIEQGLSYVTELGFGLQLPLVFLSVAEHLVARLPKLEVPVLPLRRFMRLPWELPAG